METHGCMDSIDKDRLGNLYQAVLNKEKNTTDIANEECIKQLTLIISQSLDKAASQSRTGKLWVPGAVYPTSGPDGTLPSC